MNITIQKATMEDLDLFRQLCRDSFEANKSYDTHIDTEWINGPHAEKYFEKSVTANDYLAIKAEIDGVIVGFLILNPKEDHTYRKIKIIELVDLAVLPEYRSKGVGAKLVAHAKLWARNNKFNTIYVNSYIKNERALAFYMREGFSPIDISFELDL